MNGGRRARRVSRQLHLMDSCRARHQLAAVSVRAACAALRGRTTPQQIDDLDSLSEELAFCGANVLRAWIEVEDGRIVDSGYGEGGGYVGVTRFDPGESTIAVPAVLLQDLREAPQVGGTPLASSRPRAATRASPCCGAVGASCSGSSPRSSGRRSR